MDLISDYDKQLKFYSEEDQVLLAVDCIIFGFDKEKLNILLVKRNFEPEKGKWSLMGGFLKQNEDLDEAAIRVLETLTGLNDIYMEQLYTYSKVDRDPGNRTISVAYYALINIDKYNSENVGLNQGNWFSINSVPNLIFDHSEMVNKAILRLRRRALSKPIGFELLPRKFTMRQLQKLYESILGRELDKRNFINKIQSLDVLIKLDEKDMSASRKGSYLFMFDEEKYNKKVEEEGFSFKL